MNTIYMLSFADCVDGLFDDFALDDEDLRQIARDNYCAYEDGEVHIEVRPPDNPATAPGSPAAKEVGAALTPP